MKTGRLAGDVPQRVLDGRDRGEANRARREARGLHELERDELDAARVKALDLREQVVEHRRQRAVGTVVVGLAPAADTGVGVHPHQQARAVADALHEAAQAGDLHWVGSPMSARWAGSASGTAASRRLV